MSFQKPRGSAVQCAPLRLRRWICLRRGCAASRRPPHPPTIAKLLNSVLDANRPRSSITRRKRNWPGRDDGNRRRTECKPRDRTHDGRRGLLLSAARKAGLLCLYRQWRRRSSRRRARRGAVHAAQPQLRFQRRHPDARRNLLGSPGGGIFAGEHDAGFVARGASFLIRRIPRCHFLLFIIFRLNLLHSADKEKKYNFFITKTCLKTAD